MSALLLEVESVPGDRRKLVLTMTEAGLDISGQSFAWGEIDKVRYGAVDSYLNGAYQGTTFTIHVGNPNGRKQHFILYSGTKGALKSKVDHERRDRNQAEFARAVEILEERVCAPLAQHAVLTVRNGGTVELAGLRLDPGGVHKGGLFKKSVAWAEVGGTEVKHPYFRVLNRSGKKALELPKDGWNVVLLPRVLTALRA